MTYRVGVVILTAVGLCGAVSAIAGEHGGKEHAGSTTSAPAAKEHSSATHEHGSEVAVEPSAEQLRQSIRDYIGEIEAEAGEFSIEDEVGGETRILSLVRVHERVGKTGDLYYSCTDMRDQASDELLDLDFDVESDHGELSVVDARIHKVNGEARYTYDNNDNRVSLL